MVNHVLRIMSVVDTTLRLAYLYYCGANVVL